MFSFFTGIKPWEWALLGAVLISGIAAYVVGGKYLELRDTNTRTEQTLEQAKQEVTTQTELAELADRVVSESIQSQTTKETNLIETRKEVVHEYLDQINATPEPQSPDTAQPDQPPTQTYPSEVPQSPQESRSVKRPVPTPDPGLRLSRLSERMFDRFCQAVDSDTSCHNATSPNS